MPTRAIVIFPTGDALAHIDRVRARFDPLSGVIAPHITLVFPFDSDAAIADLRTHVERTIGGVRAFPIRLSGITGHDDEYLFLNVELGGEHLTDLHDRLYSGRLSRHRSADHEYVPHLTVARLGDRTSHTSALAELASSEISLATDIREVAIVQSAVSAWHTELTVSLRP